jgi:Adenylate cyclase associated (CAP) C terminal
MMELACCGALWECCTHATASVRTDETGFAGCAGANDDDDFVESPIPEQFVSTFRDGRWVTEPVSHSGG